MATTSKFRRSAAYRGRNPEIISVILGSAPIAALKKAFFSIARAMTVNPQPNPQLQAALLTGQCCDGGRLARRFGVKVDGPSLDRGGTRGAL